MSDLILHHVSYPVRDVEISAQFYRDLFGLSLLPRPDFGIDGVWLACGDRQIHLVSNPKAGTFRLNKSVDIADVHFAFRTEDFEATLGKLVERGYSETLPKDDPKWILVIREGLAGFPQLYLLDPDRHTIEVNAAPM
ncbi:VOC family protein [Yoonia sediminilitoris]|uniref:Catechol 2,3-dioxygenase-like lactoylglutathione lyase family enzyme n=1 Tax=Yoonia sediminilitoris TaxID=1286148 RepID=A0A2T6K862_9RHOB|nr:VOC family protein [Yoonia sediminilitoris]PUB10916.1 catechol 2,3-dioxygenase-like lactoylglutathione lyase family enzyme [Yoonia sediminilitoris]RCW90591.1 catechol 2,3-dioxygenase-like lactoylglutathione lyase family enzyme [Yoonia sediminilitoris]